MIGDFNIRDSVIDFVFFCFYIEEFNNHSIPPELHGLSDHASLSVYIIIEEKFIQKKKFTIIKNNKEEKEFIKEFKTGIGNIKTSNIYSHKILKAIT